MTTLTIVLRKAIGGSITQRCRIPRLKEKLESKNEITIVGEYKYERQRVCEHRHIFLLTKKRQQPHAEMEKFQMHTCDCHDELWVTNSDIALQNSNRSLNLAAGSPNRGARSQDGSARSGIGLNLTPRGNAWWLQKVDWFNNKLCVCMYTCSLILLTITAGMSWHYCKLFIAYIVVSNSFLCGVWCNDCIKLVVAANVVLLFSVSSAELYLWSISDYPLTCHVHN